MADRDTGEFVTALAIGALFGAGAALLLRRDPPTARQRAARGVIRGAEHIRKGGRKAGRGLRSGAAAARDAGEDVLEGGRRRAGEVGGDVADIVAVAREEFARIVEERARDLEKALRRLRPS